MKPPPERECALKRTHAGRKCVQEATSICFRAELPATERNRMLQTANWAVAGLTNCQRLFCDAKAMDRDLVKSLAGAQQRRRERFPIGGVGIVLRLEAESIVPTVSARAFIAW